MPRAGSNIPPPVRGTERGSPSMSEGGPGVMQLMQQLAGRAGGAPEMGGDQEVQAAQMIMQGAQMIMQAAQINPTLEPIVRQALDVLRSGVEGMAGAAAGAEPSPIALQQRGGRRSRPTRTPPTEEAGAEEEAM